MAANLYGDAMREAHDQVISPAQMQRFAKQSIAAACTFWEEWEIAVLTPDMKLTPDLVEDFDALGVA